ncbi:MAG: RnfABCDGE type electron transport complex subunit G [Bacteroidaceae bacterium]
MKKLESTLFNMVVVLTGVTAIAAAILAYVNQVTAGPIAEANAKTLSAAIETVVPGFDNNPAASAETFSLDGADYVIYKATKEGAFIGAAVRSTVNGFGGPLTVLVGFDPEGRIIDYSVLSHAETPGLGSKAAEWFKQGNKGCIAGLNPGEAPLVVSKDGGQVEAITASTITSRAFLQAVNNAYAAYSGQHTEAVSGATPQVEASEAVNSENEEKEGGEQ